MKNAQQIISIQHELSMSIGNGLDLHELLQAFIQVSIACMDLNSAHIFLFCDEEKKPVSLTGCALMSLQPITHYMSVPTQYLEECWVDSDFLPHLVSSHVEKENIFSLYEIDDKFFHCFSIGAYGVAVFESVIEIESIIQKALLPIFKKLSLSYYACLAHQTLLKEMEARRIAEAFITYQASHDELTGLSNRRKLTENLAAALLSCEKTSKFGALLFMDLNQFKSINDIIGHDLGDKILKEVAVRLQKVVREKDTVARFGGDEFIILLPDLSAIEKDAEVVVQRTAIRIHDIIESPFLIDGISYSVGCSIGFEIFPLITNTVNEVIKNADLAMYEAKILKARSASRYNVVMSKKLNLRAACVSELKEALKNNEFMLYYQPQFNFKHEIVGAEALLRWNNPKRIQESPEVYIPIAEDSELILAIGDWVLHESCRHLKCLQEQGVPDTFKKLSINVSAKQLGQDNFFENIFRAIQTSGVNSEQMAIEITENTLVSRIHDAMVLMGRLKAIGVDCAIDDFGTGYSSLTYLKSLPSSLIKIDRSFVKDIHKDSESRSIARMIIALGENLDMDILAEGVETIEELECLKELGCSQYQGFYFARPLPFNDFLSMMSVPAEPFMIN